ncbi:MAG: acetylxylan esterase [Thermomicrobiales bacterium]|jgi:cephalosporin-C deacetylase-like acetyl esterase|nr:acetylxylan esterase [Thermomicrobiales bacterium]
MAETTFEQYWQQVDTDLARYPAAPTLEASPLRTTDYATVYHLRLTSVGPYRIFGYYSVPHGDGPFPGLFQVPRYGSVNHVPHPDDRRRYAVLQLMYRGQRLADQPFAAAYPGLLTLGITDPATYIYRSIVADCLRGAEFLLARPEVDKQHVGIRGDDLALITAARRPGFTALDATGFMFYRLLEARRQVADYPIEELNDYLRAHPDDEASVAWTLAFFDPLAHAAQVTATTLLSIGDDGTLGGAKWLQPLAHELGGPVERYNVTHEGATDHDWLDAWLAGKLGVDPLPRMWRITG